jgi:hypothetical protein
MQTRQVRDDGEKFVTRVQHLSAGLSFAKADDAIWNNPAHFASEFSTLRLSKVAGSSHSLLARDTPRHLSS